MEQVGLDKEVHCHPVLDKEVVVVEVGREQYLVQLDMVAAAPVEMFVSLEDWV